jgi:hypothetical protein
MNVDLAGGWPASKKAAYASFISLKYFRSARHDRCHRNGFVFSRAIILFASRSS